MTTKKLSTGISITNTDNLAEMIISAVKQAPKQTITYVGSDLMQTMSYQSTFDDAEKMLVNLQDAGLKSGDNVVLALEKHSDNIIFHYYGLVFWEALSLAPLQLKFQTQIYGITL